MREDQCYKKSETVTTFVNRYDLETKTDKYPMMPSTPRLKSLEMGAFEYQECLRDCTVPRPILTGRGPSHQNGSFRRSSPASCARNSPRLASAMSAPGGSAGAASRRAADAARRAASSARATMMKDAPGAGTRAGRAQPQRRSTAGSAEGESAFIQSARTTAQSKGPTATP